MIRGVIFHFGNVVCSFDVGIFLARLHEGSGVDVETLRDRIYGSRLHSRYERGEISSKEFHREVVRRIGIRGIRYTGPEELLRELSRLGVVPP